MLMCVHVGMKDLLPWVDGFDCITMYFGVDEVNMEGRFGGCSAYVTD